MSDVVEKTLTALPSLLVSVDSQPGSAKLSTSSKLGNLIRNITELTSKHEEEKLIQRELSSIKDHVSSPNTTMRQMKELMVRSIYCEMLGYDSSFTYIHAIKLAQQGCVLEKRVGYLAVSLFLNEHHELLLLLVNTVLKDLQSTNLIEVCMALTVVSQIFPKDMIPAILPLVEEKLTHPKEIIRRKAVLALYKFHLIAPNQVQHIHNKFRKALCDKDPGVMGASLHIYLHLIQENPEGYRDLTPSFVSILKQVVGGKLPMDFNYHSVPAPWIQIQLLHILALLGNNHQGSSEIMYEILEESLRRAEMNHNITYAILYECVKCIYTIHPKSDLLEKAAKCIGNFVLSPKINLKYLGLKALTYVVQQDPTLALQHQITIIQCLEHPDLIIKRETLEILFRITNAQNVTVIVEKMLTFLSTSGDDHTTINLVGKVAELAKKYAPDNEWFIQTMNTVFSLGGETMHPDITNTFLQLLSEGFDSVEEDRKLKVFAVNSYVSLLEGDPEMLPQRFLQVISWVLGEFSHLQQDVDPQSVLALLDKVLHMKSSSSETKSWVLMAMIKVCEGAGWSPLLQSVCDTYSSSLDTVLRQRVQELQYLSKHPTLRARILPPACPREPLEVDSSLSFLDKFVSEALAAGAAPYKPPHQRLEELTHNKAVSYEPYQLTLPISTTTNTDPPSLLSISSSLSGGSADLSHKESSSSLKLEGVKRVWGRGGYDAQVDRPSSPQEGEEPTLSHTPPLTSENTELQQQLQLAQLASSMFIGLDHSSVTQMGKCDSTSSWLKRKERGHTPQNDSATTSDPQELTDPSQLPQSTHTANTELALACQLPLTDNTEAALALPHQSPVAANGSSDTEVALALQSPVTANSSSDTEEALALALQSAVAANGSSDTEVALALQSPVTANSSSDTEVALALPHQSPVAANGSSDTEVALALACRDRDPERSSDDLSLYLPQELCGLICSEIRDVCSTESLQLSACHVHKLHSLEMIIFISNTSDNTVQRIQVQIHSEELEVSCPSDTQLEEVKGHSVGVYQYSLRVRKPTVHVQLTGTLSHPESPQNVTFTYRLPLSSFIRPLTVSTEEYGTMWLSFSNDTKQNLTLVHSKDEGPLRATLNLLTEELHLHVVQIIGMEAIVACRLLQDQPCLMHCRVHGDVLALWLRSPIPELPDCLIYHCQRVLQGH